MEAVEIVLKIDENVTNVSVFSSAGTIYSRSFKTAVRQMDQAIVRYVREKYQLSINQTTASAVRKQVGSALPLEQLLSVEIQGRDTIKGTQQLLTVTSEDIFIALHDSVLNITNAVRVAVFRSSRETENKFVKKIILTGGSVIRQMDKNLSIVTGLPVLIREN